VVSIRSRRRWSGLPGSALTLSPFGRLPRVPAEAVDVVPVVGLTVVAVRRRAGRLPVT
jgi:putative exporter of polyketide antibiotics